ncbi:hypothetical protein ERC79_22480 [Rhodococcus sp. ABRD24]|uniref:hypothetical protein n=1 Tax=Rhodococcus sp. ABRD24 TaxID=2507582 RepID=UPI00103BD396|nr:hypothetical protein [Rhodococcus sp. ABRD24]QBJ98393.1 hypothetical protein ERC79_22480 [Rhodococcus sp. ABRD24]
MTYVASLIAGFRRSSIAACGALALILAPMTADATPMWGPLAPANPQLGPRGTSTMHGDAGSSDATALAGPGTGAVSVAQYPLASACPTLLQGSDGLVVALCTTMLGQVPTVNLIDPDRSAFPVGVPLAELQLTKGSLLGGVYAYLDSADRLVVIDGSRHLLRIGHAQAPDGKWTLAVESSADLTSAIPTDDNVTGIAPDWNGNVWFATGAGLVGTVDTDGVTRTVQLGTGEQVHNSISTSPTATAVATTHATYQLSAGPSAQPQIDWRQEYDRGSARKPGQLSWGTGSTPTYFGPVTGSEYLTIVDNADGQVNLLVYRSATGDEVCSEPVLPPGDGGSSGANGSSGSDSGSATGSTGSGSGSENSPIGIGRSVFVASTYGYPYPTVPAGAGAAVPASAPFRGGMSRVDVDADGSGCTTVWQNQVRSSAVPHLSTADGNIYTMVRLGLDTTTPLDGFAYAVIDPDTGAVRTTRTITGTLLGDTLQMSALITADGRYMQGTIAGIASVSPAGSDSSGS